MFDAPPAEPRHRLISCLHQAAPPVSRFPGTSSRTQPSLPIFQRYSLVQHERDVSAHYPTGKFRASPLLLSALTWHASELWPLQDSSMTHAYIQRPPVATPPTQWTVWELLPCLRRQKVNKPPKPTLGDYDAGLYDPPASTPYAAEPLRNASLRGRRPTKVRLSQGTSFSHAD